MARSKKVDAIRVINNETEEIREVNIYDLTRTAYIEFGRHVNNWRQLPQIIDGLKISYRRLLYSALQFPQGKMIKSVMLLGKMSECFTGDTEILTCNNERIRFDKLVDILELGESVYTFSCDSKGNLVPSKILNAKIVKSTKDLLKITLDNGESFTCTPDHEIMLRSGVYVTADNLSEGDSLMPLYIESILDKNNTRRVARSVGSFKPIFRIMSNHPDTLMDDSIIGRNKGIQRHHIDFNSLNDRPDNLLLIVDQAHRVLHCHTPEVEKYRKPNAAKGIGDFWHNEDNKERADEVRRHLSVKAKKQWENEDLKKWRGELNSIRAKENPEKYSEASKMSANTSFRISTNLILDKIDELKMPYTSASFDKVYNLISYGNKSKFNASVKRFPNILSKFLHLDPIYKAETKSLSTLVKLSMKGLDYTLENYSNEYKLINGSNVSKGVYSYHKNHYNRIFTESDKNKLIVEYITRLIVYYNTENLNKDSYDREANKLGFSLDYNIAKDKYPEYFVAESYNYNHSVSKIEVIKSETSVNVYCLEVDSEYHNFPLASGVFVHNCHEHSTDGSYGVVAAFVKSGVFTGQGSWGVRSINGNSDPAAAPRYTEARVSDKYYKILGRLIKKVPYVESPVGPLEPTFMPVPIPISLCLDTLVSGIGLGISTDLPNFSAKSMYQAYIHDDPSLLEPNIDIDLDKGKSDLSGLWNEGRGRVVYKYRWSRIKGPDGNPGMLIEGDAGIFVPRLKRIKDWQADGKVYIEDMVTQDGAKLAIYKVPNVKSITIDDIEKEVEKICVNNNTYSLNVSDGGSAFRIPLREWIKATYTNYINLVTQDNKEEIEKVKFDIKVYSNIEQVANYIINENPKAENEEIIKATGLEPEVVSAIMSRTISNLRKTKDQTEKVKSLKDKLKELKSFNAVEFTDKIINEL